MSVAAVTFHLLDMSPCPDGQQPQRFAFRCVRNPRERCDGLLIANSGHGIKRDGQGQNGGRPQWDWDGNREAPTFAPSINCEKHCGWHGYIRGGVCVEADGSPSP